MEITKTSEIHVTFLDLEFKDELGKESTTEHWAHIAYFISTINDERERRMLVPFNDDFDKFVEALQSPILNGESVKIFYSTTNRQKVVIEHINPYGERMNYLRDADCQFVFSTCVFRGE